MNKITKILFFIFFTHYSILTTQYSFAQTEDPTAVDTTGLPPTSEPENFRDETPNSQDTAAAPAAATPVDTTNSEDTATATAAPDTTPKPKPPNKIIAEFDTFPLIIREGDVISKTLRVINGTEKQHIVTVNITYPGGWKALTNTEREYTIEPGDTFFIPIRIVPLGKIQGNTKYLIYAYVINGNRVPVASSHFLAEKQKVIKWDMNIYPDSKIYLMNDENEAEFSINIFNSGNEQVELMLDMSNFRKDRLVLMDTSGKILKKPIYTFDLLQLEDTNFIFRAKYTEGLRNFRLIDTENYRPNSKGEVMKYSIFAKSRESALQGSGKFFKGKKIDLIRLPDETKVNPYGKPSFPLIMDINFANILGAQPIMNVLLSGRTFLNNGAMLNYYAQSYFSSYFLTSQALTNTFFNIGYFTQKFNVQIGNVGGGMGGGGKGIMGNYYISRNHSIGAFITQAPRLFNGNRTAMGINHNISFGRLRLQSKYSHVSATSNNTDYLMSSASVTIAPKHTIGAGILLVRFDSKDSVFTRLVYGYNASYSGSFLNGRLQSNLNGSYMPVNFFASVPSSYLMLNHTSNIKASNSTRLQLTNRYTLRDSILSQPRQEIYMNQLNINSTKLRMAPSVFYNIVHLDTLKFHSRGLGINYSSFDYETNRMVGFNVRGGYNKIINLPNIPDYFFLQTFLFFRYRTWSGNIRYTYGSASATDMSFLRNQYPQSVGVGLNNQHQFSNPHFVLQSNFTYNYTNTLKRHSFGYTPQLFYFTNSGWRFYVTPGYYVSISKRIKNSFSRNSAEQKENEMSFNQSVIINAGVRKEFGIPIPWLKTKYPTLTFKAFIDHNGNNKQDAGEVSLDNVVVKLGEWEVLTNEKGFATFRNVFGDSIYPISAFSLVDLKGYFPNLPPNISAVKDSLHSVPFVKGVKVHGNVYLDREKIAAGSEKPLDLTGIRITALNGKAVNTLTDGKGDFSFYVPYGKYTITMDEKVLGDRFTLLQNNIEMELDQKTESIFITFYIVEKRRKITVKKFDSNGKKVGGSDTTITPKPKTLEELKKEEEQKQKGGLSPGAPGKNKGTGTAPQTPKSNEKEKAADTRNPIDKNQIKFKVRVGALNTNIPSDAAEKLKAMPYMQENISEDGLTQFISQDLKDYESAQMLREELISSGIASDTTFVIIIADYNGVIIDAEQARELMKY